MLKLEAQLRRIDNAVKRDIFLNNKQKILQLESTRSIKNITSIIYWSWPQPPIPAQS